MDASTFLTVLPCESSSTQTEVSLVCKTSLTGCVVLARFLHTGVLKQNKTTYYYYPLYFLSAFLYD